MNGTNFGAAAADYGTHRAGFPDSLFDRLDECGVGTAGQNVVDLGTGTGHLARGLARRGCRVIGIDVDARMLERARELDAGAGVTIEYRVGRAEQPELPAGSADVVTAAQCWHWFDRPVAARAVRDLLVAGGTVAIVHFDWLPLRGNVVEATEALIRTHNPRWSLHDGDGIYPRWPRDLAEAGFSELRTFSYDVDVPYDHVGWRGRIRASAGVGAALAPAEVARFDDELSTLLARRYPEPTLAVPHRVFVAHGRAPGEGDRR